MTKLATDDDQLDPLERMDQEDEQEDEREESTPEQPEQPEGTPAVVELGPEIENEIKKVIVPEESDSSAVKAKNHLIPRKLIEEPLDPSKDLWDEDGSI